MKKLYTLLTAVLLTVSAFLPQQASAQSPDKMSYQAVVRDAGNALVTSQAVGMQLSILQGSVTGTAVYVETQTPTTNINGLVSIELGSGTVVSGTFNSIDWSNGPYFIKTETDPTGGTTYTITGTSQLLSVPYALHANTADSIVGGVSVTETDPIFGASIASGITGSDTANWNNHTVDIDTQLDSTGVAALGFVAGAHTVDTDTQLDSTDIANLGYTAGVHYLGEQFGGGVIYHLYIGSDGNQHGLIVNTTESTSVWQVSATLTNATHSWDGETNTGLMTSSAAANYVNGLTDGGFTDWYLPSIDELNLLYNNRFYANKALSVIGGATLLSTTDSYWSSTENLTTSALYFFFSTGYGTSGNKVATLSIRAVRGF